MIFCLHAGAIGYAYICAFQHLSEVKFPGNSVRAGHFQRRFPGACSWNQHPRGHALSRRKGHAVTVAFRGVRHETRGQALIPLTVHPSLGMRCPWGEAGSWALGSGSSWRRRRLRSSAPHTPDSWEDKRCFPKWGLGTGGGGRPRIHHNVLGFQCSS